MRSNAGWRVYPVNPYNDYEANRLKDGRIESKELPGKHCLACAKADFMLQTGSLVDIRGWHKQGLCGSFLKAVYVTIKYDDLEQENIADGGQ